MLAWLKARTVRRRVANAAERPAVSASAHAKLEAAVEVGEAAIEYIRRGQFYQACDALRDAIRIEPGNASHRVNFAYALQQCGAADEARVHLQEAVALAPGSFDAHYMLAASSEEAGDLDTAARSLRRAVELNEGFEAAHVDLCRVLAQIPAARDEARALLATEIERFPENADLCLYQGNLCLEDKDAREAASWFARALALRPGDAGILGNLGLAQQSADQPEEARATLEALIAIAPDKVQGYANLASVLRTQGDLDRARAVLERALAIWPDDADALNSYGSVLQTQGRTADAARGFRRVLELRPELPGGYANLGLALYELGQVSEAVGLYRKGLALRPIAEIHDNLAIALQKQGFVDEAIENYRAALALQPDNVNTQCNLAAALADGGQAHAAVAAYRSILDHHPNHMVAHSNLLFNLSFDEHCSPEQYLAEARSFSDKAMRAASSSCQPVPCESPGRHARPLKLGFVSGDLRVHPVGYFLEGVLRHLDRSRFRLFAYSTVAQEDVLTARLRPLFDGWRSVKGLDDAAAASAIRQDGIDLLVDLAGHTGDNRLPVFAFRPAPVQITWLGYFASTGLASMDYIIADELCVPSGSEHAFTESVYRLPDTRLCFTPPTDGSMPEVSPSPARRTGQFTFGCFQRLPKITPAVLHLWGRIFAAVPHARLFLQSHQTGRKLYVDEILARLASVGIAGDRVTVKGPAPRTAYLEAYAEVDVILDTFPYTGGTTTCEAMWMGVPTVTLAGTSMIGRQGVALLTAAGLAEWVAQSEDEYVAKAVRAATDVDALSALRERMRGRVKASALFDVARFASHLGDALETMWARVPATEADKIRFVSAT